MQKFHVLALALAAGILWAVAVLALALMALYWGWATEIVALLADGYRGFGPTWGGGIVGAVWAFFDAFVGAAIFAWLYNWLVGKLK